MDGRKTSDESSDMPRKGCKALCSTSSLIEPEGSSWRSHSESCHNDEWVVVHTVKIVNGGLVK